MRIKVLSRDEKSYTRERPTDLQRVHRNAAPSIHPFERAREYKRALNATKLDRMFAKPFVAALEGHADGVYCIRRHPIRLSTLASGACDGGKGFLSSVSLSSHFVFFNSQFLFCVSSPFLFSSLLSPSLSPHSQKFVFGTCPLASQSRTGAHTEVSFAVSLSRRMERGFSHAERTTSFIFGACREK